MGFLRVELQSKSNLTVLCEIVFLSKIGRFILYNMKGPSNLRMHTRKKEKEIEMIGEDKKMP